MAAYTYKAIDLKGLHCTGTSEAANLESLSELLKNRGLFLMEGKLEKLSLVTPSAAPFVKIQSTFSSHKEKPITKVPLDALTLFTSELTIMVRTALPVTEALATLSKQQRHPGFKLVLEGLCQDVQQGKTLSDSFERFPQVFGPIYIALLRAGEVSGTLPLMLERLADYLRFQREMKSKITTALLYPVIIIVTGIGVVGLLIVFILPTFAEIFAQLNAALPLPTRVLLAFSNHVRHAWWMYAALIGGLLWWFQHWLSHPINREALERMELKLPIIGSMVRNIVITRVLRTLGALVAGGVPILESLQLAGAAASHTVFHDIMSRVRRNAAEGKGLATALADEPNFPEAAAHMIGNAELTGSLPEVLAQISQFYEQETDMSIRKFLAVLEPVFVLVIGVAVGIVAASILWPMFHLDGANV